MTAELLGIFKCNFTTTTIFLHFSCFFTGIVVAGGQGCGYVHEGCSNKVEFLALPSQGIVAHDLDKGLDGIIRWEAMPDLHFPHAYNPAVAYVKEKLYVVGGGDFDLTMASDKVGSTLNIFSKEKVKKQKLFIFCTWLEGKIQSTVFYLLLTFLVRHQFLVSLWMRLMIHVLCTLLLGS